MAVDRRRRNAQWSVLDEWGNTYTGNYGGAQLAVLMDIRDELQRLNQLLHCPNFMAIPHTLKSIDRKVTKKRPARKAVK